MLQSIFSASLRIILAALALSMLQLALTTPARAVHTSLVCTERTATVANGGSVVVDLNTCHTGLFYPPFAVGTVSSPTVPSHGTAVISESFPPYSIFVTYTHNGNSATTDFFEFYDENGDVIRVTITISAPVSPVTVSPASLPTLTAGTPFSQTLTSTGGTAPYSYALQSGSLPVGLSLTSGGVISGTPTQRGAYSFIVRSTDSIAQFADKSYSGTVQNPTLSLVASSGTAIQGIAFSQALSTTGGVAPHTYALDTGTLPAGITLSSAGVLSGTTNAAPGSYPVTIRVTDSSTGTGSYFEAENFTLTVSPPPSVSISVSPASISEDGATNATFTVTRSLNLASPTTVNLSPSGTATSGTDYTGGVATVTIPAGATTATITIDPTVDGTVEPDETVTYSIAAGTGYTVGAPSSATATILNDDVPSATITVSPAAVAEDAAANLIYTVTLSQAAFNPVSISYTVGGSATNGTDYATIASPLVINTGVTTGTITVNPTADASFETDETVVLTLASGAGYTVGVPNAATGTILNDDLPSLTINDVTASEGNAGTTNFTFTVSLSQPAGPGGVTFDIATANGTATAGVDYVAQSLTGQTIPAGSSTYTLTVQVNGDTLNEPTETFFVNVTNVINAVVVDGQGLGTIVNDDPQPSLSINDVTLVEGNSGTTNAVFTVTLSAASGQTVTVNYATADGTATQPADYTSTSGTVTFAPGQTIRTLGVPVIGDSVPEANETFFVNLSGATNATIADNQGLGTITNDDVPVTVSPGALPGGTVAAAYSQSITASGGTAPYTFTVTAGALPGGLTLSASGVLSGTPTAGGSFNFTVTATDSSPFPGPFSGSQAYSLTIAPPTIALPATSLAGGTLGSPYSDALTPASGGTAPYSYAVTAGALPGGLTLNAGTGAVTGTPTALGTFNFSVTATDSSTGTGPYSATQNYSILVVDQPPVANAVSLTVAYNAGATNVPISISGGTPTSVAQVSAPGNGTVVVSGTTITYQPNPGFAGSDSFTYSATNSGGTSAPATVSVTVTDPAIAIAPSGSLSAAVAAPYSVTFSFSGGATPWSGYQVTNLPTGLSITGTTANSVTVSGTPTQAGTFNLNVSATDSSTGNGPYAVGQAFSMNVAAPTLAMSPGAGALPAPYALSFSQGFTASGGTGSYSYALTGTLPAGLSFSNGTISGTPTAPGSYPVTVTATDTVATGAGAPFAISQNYVIDVPAPNIVVGPTSLPDPTLGGAYIQLITASGGAISYDFALSAGSLPSGIVLDNAGNLTGTSYEVGTFNFTVTVTDGYGQTGSRSYSLTIASPILTMSPGAGTLSATYAVPYSQAFAASGGSGTFGYALTGTLPAGLSFSNGTISGTPTAAGSYAISVTATDLTVTGTGAPFSVTRNYTLDVPAPTIAITPGTLQAASVGSAYSQALSASGGAGTHTLALTSGNLPTGLTFSGGTISGTPTEAGSFGLTITATDIYGQTGTQSYTLTVGAPSLGLAPGAGALNAPYAQAFSQSFSASGGTGSYSYALTGTLPTGLSFGNGTISGTPIAPGSYSVNVTATDTVATGAGAPFTVTQAYTIEVAAPTIVLAPANLPVGTAGAAYSVTLTGSGAVGPYRFALTSGALPAGLTLAEGGLLSGTPVAAGTFPITVQITDANGQTATAATSVTISNADLTITPTELPGGIQGIAYSQQFTAAGGVAPYSYAVTAGNLPAGLTLSAQGLLSGTPTGSGTASFTLTVTDSTQGTPSTLAVAYSLVIAARPNPADDPEVRALAQAQVNSARRFVESQTGNFNRRLEGMRRGDGQGGFRNSIRLSGDDRCLDAVRSWTFNDCGEAGGSINALANGQIIGGESGGTRWLDGGNGSVVRLGGGAIGSAPAANAEARGAAGGQGSDAAPWTLWAAGTVRFGDREADTGLSAQRFETEGITLGADYRFSPSFAAGVGIGFGRDTTDVGEETSQSRGEAKTVAIYGSHRLGGGFYFDWLTGYQWLDFDLRRYVTMTGATVNSSRSGHQWFGAISAGADIENGNLRFTPYARIDAQRGQLDGYTEDSGSAFDLRYLDQDLAFTAIGLGAKADYRVKLDGAFVLPRLRIEYQHDIERNGDAFVGYYDQLDSAFSAIPYIGYSRSRLLLGIGSEFLIGKHTALDLEYNNRRNSGAGSDNGVEISLTQEF